MLTFLSIPRTPAAVLLALVLVLATAQAGAQRFEQGLLWRVEGAGSAASHVFGTIHVDDPRVTELPPAVARALNESRSVTVEVSLDPSNVMALATRMIFQDGRDLAGIAGTELFGKTTAITAKLGLPEQALRMFKPWAAALMLMMPQQDPENVLDTRNVRMADRMQARLNEGRAFVAVGALHLYGDRGVLALLERRGWSVTRVY